MGLFNTLKAAFGGGAGKPPDRVWFNKMAKYKGLRQFLAELNDSRRIWVLTHFEESLCEVKLALEIMKLDFAETVHHDDLKPAQPGRITVTPADLLLSATTLAPLIAPPDLILITEHYPMPDKDASLIEKLRVLAPTAEIFFYVDLTEPFFTNKIVSGGGRIARIMERLEWNKDEALEHPLLSRSIISAQRRFAQVAKGDQPARSQEEWFELNL